MKNIIQEQGYIFIEKFMDYESCDVIIEEFNKAKKGELEKNSASLNDSNDNFNHVYTSSRSPLKYCYLKSDITQKINQNGIKKLNLLTELDWQGNINDICFPIFKYELNEFIEAHRGRNIGYGDNDFVAVLMLTEYDIDFSYGEFYLNKNAFASKDGKQIFDEDIESRIYFKQKKGSLLIFNNNIHVHGTNPVKESAKGSSLRMTTSWRTTENK